jgi:hypothetical protein
MLQILHIKLAENVAAPTSKMETAEKWESDDVLQSLLEQLSPAVSAAAMVDEMVGSREMDFWPFGLKSERVEYLTTHGYWIAVDLCDGSVTVIVLFRRSPYLHSWRKVTVFTPPLWPYL